MGFFESFPDSLLSRHFGIEKCKGNLTECMAWLGVCSNNDVLEIFVKLRGYTDIARMDMAAWHHT